MFHKLVKQAIDNFNAGEDELSLISTMPLFDKGCSSTWPGLGVKERFIKGISATEDIITFFMSKGSVMLECNYNGLSLADIIYKKLRTTTVHQGKMPDNVQFIDGNQIVIKGQTYTFPSTISWGIFLAAIGFECYSGERDQSNVTTSINAGGHTVMIKEAIGNHDYVRGFIRKKFGRGLLNWAGCYREKTGLILCHIKIKIFSKIVWAEMSDNIPCGKYQ